MPTETELFCPSRKILTSAPATKTLTFALGEIVHVRFLLHDVMNMKLMSYETKNEFRFYSIQYNSAPTTLKSEGEVTSLSGADKREVRDNMEKW